MEQKSLIVGAGELARKLAVKIRQEGSENLLGIVHNQNDMTGEEYNRYLVLCNISDLRELVQRYEIKKIYIALPADQMGNIESVYIDMMDLQADVIWVPDFTT